MQKEDREYEQELQEDSSDEEEEAQGSDEDDDCVEVMEPPHKKQKIDFYVIDSDSD